MRKGVVIALLAVLLLAPSVIAPYTGTIEGYVYYLNGTLTGSGASVNVSIASCSGSGCTGTTTTDSNSYYVIANLNLPSSGTITATGGKNLHNGANTTTANAFQAAYANISVCQPPSTPTLHSTPSNHDTNRTLNWSSGTDPNGFNTYDVFQFASNSSIINATSPQSVNNLTIGSSYTWRVSTCNTYLGRGCCSANSSVTFSVSNSAPSAPTLTHEPNTDSTTVSLEWTSGTDSDGDTTHDEFQFSATSDFSDIITSSSSATSPQSVSSLANTTAYFWRVRTCDAYTCGSYSTDNFTVYTCPALTTTTTSGGGGGGGGSSCGGQNECQLADKACRGNNRLVCGNFDTDAFLEWNVIPCKPWQRCENGQCIEACTETWTCEDWGACSIAGLQTRTCEDVNVCGTTDQQPPRQRACVPGAGESPVLLGVPPFMLNAPTVLTSPVVPFGTGLLGFLLGLLTLSLLFDRQFTVALLLIELRKMAWLIGRNEIAKAEAYNTRVVDPHIRKAVLDDRKPAHRKVLRIYYALNGDIARYHERQARKSGEKSRADAFAKRAAEFTKLVETYS